MSKPDSVGATSQPLRSLEPADLKPFQNRLANDHLSIQTLGAVRMLLLNRVIVCFTSCCLSVGEWCVGKWCEERPLKQASVLATVDSGAEPKQDDPASQTVVAAELLAKVKSSIDFSGSGGEVGSTYHALHVLYYRFNTDSRQEFRFERNDAVVPAILRSAGYRPDPSQPAGDIPYEFFPYEVAWILGEFCQGESLELIRTVAESTSQHPMVRLACVLALKRTGHSVDVANFIDMVRAESDRERKIIGILLMRWFGGDAKSELLGYMSHHDSEIATAAACALTDIRPDEAVTKFAELLEREHFPSLVLLLGTLAEYKQQSARDLFEKLLRDALSGVRHMTHLDRIVDASASAWGINQVRYRTSNSDSAELQGKRILELMGQLRIRQAEYKLKLEGQLENCRTQLTVAEEIAKIRRQEFKRLLLLQSEGIIEGDVSQRAEAQLDVANKEVLDARQKLLEIETRFGELDRQIPGFD